MTRYLVVHIHWKSKCKTETKILSLKLSKVPPVLAYHSSMKRAMKEIVAWDNGSNENLITFKFPRLNIVSLKLSFELVSFYRGTHTLEWPSLNKLSIVDCFKLEGLTKDITNSQGKPIVLATEKVIYNLESMEMSLKEAEWLQKYITSQFEKLNIGELSLEKYLGSCKPHFT
ncbi:hypothetical protein JHK82_051335 [Glycine max]|nr:hypothetical protein JHK82_051335 [Glycine max]